MVLADGRIAVSISNITQFKSRKRLIRSTRPNCLRFVQNGYLLRTILVLLCCLSLALRRATLLDSSVSRSAAFENLLAQTLSTSRSGKLPYLAAHTQYE
jgi:hypothetical protein